MRRSSHGIPIHASHCVQPGRNERQKIAIILCGLRQQPRRLMRDGHLKERFKSPRIRPDMDAALQAAEEELARRAASGGTSKIVVRSPVSPA